MKALSQIFRQYANRLLLTALLGPFATPGAAQRIKNWQDMPEQEKTYLNDSIVDAARERFEIVAWQAGNIYSHQLNTLKYQVNEYMRRNGPGIDGRALVIDPLKFDIGLALGLDADSTTRLLLKSQHSDRISEDHIEQVKSLLHRAYITSTGETTYLNTPAAAGYKGEPSIIVAADIDAQPDLPQKMPYADFIDFANRHEGWHVVNSRYNYNGIDTTCFRDDDWLTMALWNKDLLRDDNLLKAALISHHSENLADVGAAGDKIRRGRKTSFIDQVLDWRDSPLFDADHITAPALRELKRRIGEMGLAAFRAMGEKQVQDFYYDIVDQSALSVKSYRLLLEYEQAGDSLRQDFNRRADADPAMRQALEYHQLLTAQKAARTSPAEPTEAQQRAQKLAEWNPIQKINARIRDANLDNQLEPGTKPLSMHEAYVEVRRDLRKAMKEDPSLKELNTAKIYKLEKTYALHQKLERWDAPGRLRAKARQLDGSVLPQSLAKAYGVMLDELREELRQSPRQLPLLCAKMIHLKTVFIDQTRTLDYVKLNRGRLKPDRMNF